MFTFITSMFVLGICLVGICVLACIAVKCLGKIGRVITKETKSIGKILKK